MHDMSTKVEGELANFVTLLVEKLRRCCISSCVVLHQQVHKVGKFTLKLGAHVTLQAKCSF